MTGELVRRSGSLPASKVEDMLGRVQELNKPFHDAILQQMGAIQAQMVESTRAQSDMRVAVEIIISQNLVQKITDQDLRLRALEAERQERTGIVTAATWAPKVFGYLTIIILAILYYLKSKGTF